MNLSERDFIAGDIVKLKTNDQKMTVECVTPYGVICLWFDVNNHLHRQPISAVALERIINGK